jgi:hypothetical protein
MSCQGGGRGCCWQWCGGRSGGACQRQRDARGRGSGSAGSSEQCWQACRHPWPRWQLQGSCGLGRAQRCGCGSSDGIPRPTPNRPGAGKKLPGPRRHAGRHRSDEATGKGPAASLPSSQAGSSWARDAAAKVAVRPGSWQAGRQKWWRVRLAPAPPCRHERCAATTTAAQLVERQRPCGGHSEPQEPPSCCRTAHCCGGGSQRQRRSQQGRAAAATGGSRGRGAGHLSRLQRQLAR